MSDATPMDEVLETARGYRLAAVGTRAATSIGKLPRVWLLAIASLAELAALAVSAGAAQAVALPNHGTSPAGMAGAMLVALVASAFLSRGVYLDVSTLLARRRPEAGIVIRWLSFCALASGLLAVFHPQALDWRSWSLAFCATGLPALILARAAVGELTMRWVRAGNIVHRIALVGATDLARRVVDRLRAETGFVGLIGVFDDRSADRIVDIPGVVHLGSVADLLNYARARPVDTIVVTLPIAAAERVRAILRRLREQPARLCVLPGEIGFGQPKGGPLAGLDLHMVSDRPVPELGLLCKQIFDRSAAALLIVLVSPVLLVAAAGIKLTSPGPILFRQQRIGYRGRPFDILKFRTMHQSRHRETRLTARNDKRVFAFGGFLRRTSLDELPQLFNVLRGDMSLVGPRPHMLEALAAGTPYALAVQDYMARHRVMPGITGWAQVHGWRGPTETIEQIEGRVRHDLYYAEHWSLALDLEILVRTIFVLAGRNAF